MQQFWRTCLAVAEFHQPDIAGFWKELEILRSRKSAPGNPARLKRRLNHRETPIPVNRIPFTDPPEQPRLRSVPCDVCTCYIEGRRGAWLGLIPGCWPAQPQRMRRGIACFVDMEQQSVAVDD